jgi:hypothetical protein
MTADSNLLCAYCHMPLSLHCSGNTIHSDSAKVQKHLVRCATRHSLAPLCDCINFVEANHAAIQTVQRRPQAA